MKWATVIKNIEEDKFQMLIAGDRIDMDHPSYLDQDVHIVPCIDSEAEIVFGVHEFTRECYCRPKIETKDLGRTMVIHTYLVN